MSAFKNVGEAIARRDGLITKLAANRDVLQKSRNAKESPSKAASVAAAEAAHDKDCGAFADAHIYVVANRG
ncbi:hypothetical protein ABIB06_002455 [Bradyrhizobium sp. LB8.2]|uniref:hypothetical protein n=1 Tax=unclassified Bradyrhizobium TaxID=2631580 RepID=UPI003399C13F